LKIGISNFIRSNKKHLKNVIGAIALINLLLAFTALIKDVMLAMYVGTSSHADALLLALFIPDTLGNGLIAAAMGVACIPVFSLLHVANKNEQLERGIKNISMFVSLIAVALITVLILFRYQIISFLASGFNPDTRELCVKLFIIMLPTLLLFPVIYIGISVLQVHNRFRLPAIAPIIFNSFFLFAIMAGMLLNLPILKGVYIIAIAISLGVLSMLLFVWLPLIKGKGKLVSIKLSLRISSEDVKIIKDILKVFLPYLIILFFQQGIQYVERYLASTLGEGSIAGLNYAYRLAQFPLWVFVSAVGTVILPAMAKARGNGNEDELKTTLGKSARLVLMIVMPVTIGLYILRVPIISYLFYRGAFDSKSLQITDTILAGYSLGIIGQSIMILTLKYFLAVRKMFVPVVIYIISAIANIAIDFILVSKIGLAGIGYGAAICAIINPIIVLFYLKKRIKFNISGQARYFFKVVAANVPVAITFVLILHFWHALKINNSFIGQTVFLLIGSIIFIVIYRASLKLFTVL